MASIKKAIEFMRVACDEWSLGYDQYQRWNVWNGGECDCSSLVITALRKAGFDTGSASYTGDMSSNLTRRGWKRMAFRLADVRPGDILLNDTHHVCMVISGNGSEARIAQASIDERGRATGGATGDQTGHETNTRGIYIYRYGWNCILRYTKEDPPKPTPSGKLDVDGVLGVKSITAWQEQLKTPIDGVVSGQWSPNRVYYPALVSVTFEADGSALVEKLQRKIYALADPGDFDGLLGYNTVKALQTWLTKKGYKVGTYGADGVLGADTAKAIQRALNGGAFK